MHNKPTSKAAYVRKLLLHSLNLDFSSSVFLLCRKVRLGLAWQRPPCPGFEQRNLSSGAAPSLRVLSALCKLPPVKLTYSSTFG